MESARMCVPHRYSAQINEELPMRRARCGRRNLHPTHFNTSVNVHAHNAFNVDLI
eukprot:COSAG06_NODE_1956_length_7985_cov_17.502156_4_plen_55_part_00